MNAEGIFEEDASVPGTAFISAKDLLDDIIAGAAYHRRL
jgi:hypothetical protein